MAHFDPFGAMTSSQVKVDDFLLPAPRGEAHEVQQPWMAGAEPRVQNVSTDGLSWFRNGSSCWNNSGVEEFLRALEYNPIGGLGHYGTGGQDSLELGVLDDLFGGMHKTDNFLAANEISREFEGYLLNQDLAAAEKVFEANHVICEGSVPRNSISPGFGISNNVAYIGSAESTTAGVREAQFKTSSVSKTRICPREMHGTRLNFQATADYDIYGNSEGYDQINMEPSPSQGEDRKIVDQATKTCFCSPEWKWKSVGRRSKRVVKKCCGAKSSDQERSNDTEEEFLTGAVDLQTPHESSPLRVPRKRRPVYTDLKLGDLYTSSDSEDDHRKNKTLGCKKSNDRRKHHVMWTTSEVSELIEGVAQHGIGRWTDIKKLHFSSSAHRTPIDLRDKWRNLVKASQDGKQKRWNQGVDQRSYRRVLPEALMARVVELTSMHMRNNNK